MNSSSTSSSPIRFTGLALLLSTALCLSGCGEAAAGTCCDAEQIKAADAERLEKASKSASAMASIPDTVLIDQNGKKVRLMSDLIKGHRVAINFVFSTCTTVCPTLQSVFENVQEELGSRLGDDVRLLSISVDPLHDTPARMASFAKDFSARPGWHFLTGEPEEVIEILKAFGVYTQKKEEHSSLFVLGNEPAGKWMYQGGFTSAKAVVAQLDML